MGVGVCVNNIGWAPSSPSQVVILIVAHNEQGSMGLILNRPTSLVFGTKTKDKKSGLPFPVEVRGMGSGERCIPDKHVIISGYVGGKMCTRMCIHRHQC